MKIEAKIYRLTSDNLDIQKILNYNFFDYEDSFSSKTFWRNVFTKKQQQQRQQTKEEQKKRDIYRKFYEDELDKIINLVKDNGLFNIEEIDIGKNIEGYTVNKRLNQVFRTQEILFKEQTKVIVKENDLIVIKEDGKTVMIGFVVSLETSITYGDFIVKSATIGDIGFLYSIVFTVAVQSNTDYALTGRDTKDLEVSPFTDNYNNLNIFQIVERIMNNYMYAFKTSDPEKVNTNNYFFNTASFNRSFKLSTPERPASFATMFVFLRLLERFILKKAGIEKAIQQPTNPEDPGFQQQQIDYAKQQRILELAFQWAEVEHGEHKVYNKMARTNFEQFRPSFKTAAAVFDDVIKKGMYNFFIDVGGKFIVRPPLYNYYGPLPEDNAENPAILEEELDGEKVYILNKSYNNFIKEKEILSDKLIFDNINIKTRTDTLFVFPLEGEIDWIPPFYIDLKGLVKYGFRNSEPYTNPNATTAELATMLAAILNIIENSMTRKLEIVVKTQNIDRFKIGEMYYIDKIIQGAVNGDGEETGTFGYLVDMSRNVNYGEFPTTTLTFSYLRTMEMVEPKLSVGTKSGNTQDLINIYKKYGIFKNIDVREITSSEFETKSKEEFKIFEGQILEKKQIPAFKVFPTILDFIKITYEDFQTTEKTKEKKSEQKQTENTDLTISGTLYKSFKVKLQRFFDVQINNGRISSFTSPKYSTFGNTEIVTRNEKIPGFTKNLYGAKANQIINHQGYNYTIYPDRTINLDVYKFDTGFVSNYLKNIKQVLFNRIIECDAGLKDHFEAILSKYSPKKIPQEITIPKRDVNNFALLVSSKDNNFFSILSTDTTTLDSYRYDGPLINFNAVDVDDVSPIFFINNTSGIYIIHPQCTLTMDMLQLNILLSSANTLEAEKIIKKIGQEKQHLIESHQKGKAIDIHVPTQNTKDQVNWKAQFLFPFLEFMPLSKGSDGKYNIVKTQITYKPAFYTLFEDTLKKHFDIVKKFENIQFDISSLGLKDSSGEDIISYYADVYHLEVRNTNYLQITPELLEPGNATYAITT